MLIMENIFQLTARKKLTKTGPCMRSPFKGVHGVTPYLQCQYQFIIIEIKTVLVSKPSYGKGVLMSRLIRQNVKLLSECLTFQVYKKNRTVVVLQEGTKLHFFIELHFMYDEGNKFKKHHTKVFSLSSRDQTPCLKSKTECY